MYNKVIMIGNLTRDIELKYLPSGSAIANGAIATSHKYKTQSGEQKEEVCFIDYINVIEEENHGKGLGKEALEEFISEIKKTGIKKFYLFKYLERLNPTVCYFSYISFLEHFTWFSFLSFKSKFND